MQKEFIFDKKKQILIYGCSGTGVVFYKLLKKNGYSVGGFFDKNAKKFNYGVKVEQEIVPVFRIEDHVTDFEERKKLVIIIAIRNPVEQKEVAFLLGEYGYDNCIYMPLEIGNKYNNIAVDDMRFFYRRICDGGFIKDTVLPTQSALNKSGFYDQAIIEEDGKTVVAWVPISLIYLETVAEFKKQKEEYKIYFNDTSYQWADKNVVSIRYIIEIFKFLFDGTGHIESSLNFLENIKLPLQIRSSREEQFFLQDRQRCFCILSQALNQDISFFIKSANLVKWNKKGYFNILDGRHRILFLYVKGFDKVPVQMSKNDYETWLNKDKIRNCEQYLSNIEHIVLTVPIQHPFFYHVKSQRENFGKTLISSIQEFIGIKKLNDKTVLDINAGEGYFAQHFARMGAKTYALEQNRERFVLANILNELYQVPPITMFNQDICYFDTNEQFDIVLAFKALSIDDKVEQLNVLKCIDRVVKEEMFWESGKNIAEEKELILKNSAFKSYEKIRNTFDGKCIGELGVFKK